MPDLETAHRHRSGRPRDRAPPGRSEPSSTSARTCSSIVYQSSRRRRAHRAGSEEQAKICSTACTSVRQQVDVLVCCGQRARRRGRATRRRSRLPRMPSDDRRISAHTNGCTSAYEIFAPSEPLGRWDRDRGAARRGIVAAAAAEGDITCAPVRAGPSRSARRSWLDAASPKERLALVPLASTMGGSGTFGSAAMAARYAAGRCWSQHAGGRPARWIESAHGAHTSSSGFFELGIVRHDRSA